MGGPGRQRLYGQPYWAREFLALVVETSVASARKNESLSSHGSQKKTSQSIERANKRQTIVLGRWLIPKVHLNSDLLKPASASDSTQGCEPARLDQIS